MYKEYFGLIELPFSIAPDPRYLYMSNQHREALAHLVYGMNSDGGFILITGEVGTGKTTVCRCFLEQIPENIDVAFILNPKMTAEELLASICDELRIQYNRDNSSIKVFVDHINAYLLDAHARGRKTVLIIEEAQNLSTDVLEQIRLLTNLETNQQKLLQIIMLGQPELRDKLSRSELRQLSQRVTARYHLGPLSRQEVSEYVNHRLSVAGVHKKLFPDSIINRLYHLSNGIPRLINLICDRALLGVYAQGKERVDRPTLLKAAHEVTGKHHSFLLQRKSVAFVLAFLIIAGIVTVLVSTIMSPVSVKKPSPPSNQLQAKIDSQQLSKLEWSGDKPIEKSREMAYQSLFKQWGIPYNPSERNPCDQALQQGLGCLKKKVSLNKLIQLNRPALLKLLDDQGNTFYATLTGVQGTTATFDIDSENKFVTTVDIALRWRGDYIMLWKLPPGYKDLMTLNSQGPQVTWLSKQLAHVQGNTEQPSKDLLDEKLMKQVKNFQLARGLVPDGIVGPQTIIHLHSAAGTDEPILMSKKKDT